MSEIDKLLPSMQIGVTIADEMVVTAANTSYNKSEAIMKYKDKLKYLQCHQIGENYSEANSCG